MMKYLGTDYADLRNFRRHAKSAILKIRAVYPLLNLGFTHGGVEIRPGAPAIPSRLRRRPATISA
jgi:hypothetical protein